MVFMQFFLADRVAASAAGESGSGSGGAATVTGRPFEIALIGWDCAAGATSAVEAAEAASGVFSGVYAVSAAAAALPGGLLSDGIGRRTTLALAFLLQAAAFGGIGLTTNFSVVLLAAGVVGGVASGLANGAVFALYAEVLPSKGSASRDMNLLMTSQALSQTLVSLAAGRVLAAFGPANARAAYVFVWGGAAALLAPGLPLPPHRARAAAAAAARRRTAHAVSVYNLKSTSEHLTIKTSKYKKNNDRQ
jgi:MFS family permease